MFPFVVIQIQRFSLSAYLLILGVLADVVFTVDIFPLNIVFQSADYRNVCKAKDDDYGLVRVQWETINAMPARRHGHWGNQERRRCRRRCVLGSRFVQHADVFEAKVPYDACITTSHTIDKFSVGFKWFLSPEKMSSKTKRDLDQVELPEIREYTIWYGNETGNSHKRPRELAQTSQSR
ncbi:hypothetical protein IWX48DRAFT_658407 [Phyllosticta citricarpa]